MVDRRIFFFRVDVGFDPGSVPIEYDPIPTLQLISGLGWDEQDGRYWHDEEGKVTCCWVDRIDPPQRMRLANIRRDALPAVEAGGQLSLLNLPEGSGLAEQTHIVFFGDNIVGVEYNHYGPKISRLPYYLAERAQGVAPEAIVFQPLLRNDVAEQLDHMVVLRHLTLKMRPAFATSLEAADHNASESLRLIQEATGAEEVEITIGMRSHSRESLPNRALQIARSLVGHTAFRHEAIVARAYGVTGDPPQLDELDLLNDKLVSTREVVYLDDRHRIVDSNSAYAAIESARDELAEELATASAIWHD